MSSDVLFNLGNVIFLIGVLWMIKELVKNRDAIRGYSIFGSFLTLLGTLLFNIAFYITNNLFSFWIGWPMVSFWLLAFIFSYESRKAERSHS
jgi:hypothetical protein